MNEQDARHYTGMGSCKEAISNCYKLKSCDCSQLPPECQSKCKRTLEHVPELPKDCKECRVS